LAPFLGLSADDPVVMMPFTTTTEVPSVGDRSAEQPRAARPRARGRSRARSGYRTVWVSDLHLGTRGCKAELLLDFLENVSCERMYLVGDVIDGWALRRKVYWDATHSRVLERILALGRGGTRVTYVCGNHDEFLRRYAGVDLGGVSLVDEAVHATADGRRLLVVHGDRYDVTIRNAPWLAHLGDRAYRFSLVLNDLLAFVRKRLGYPYWSLSAYLKRRVKKAVSFVESFERAVVAEARERGFDGAVCGHIHHAEIRTVDGILYANDGDWVESCTALVEHHSGRLEILRWTREGEDPRRARTQREARTGQQVDHPEPAWG